MIKKFVFNHRIRGGGYFFDAILTFMRFLNPNVLFILIPPPQHSFTCTFGAVSFVPPLLPRCFIQTSSEARSSGRGVFFILSFTIGDGYNYIQLKKNNEDVDSTYFVPNPTNHLHWHRSLIRTRSPFQQFGRTPKISRWAFYLLSIQ